MTVIAGVLCADGVVLGSDTTVTTANGAGDLVAKDRASKLRIFTDEKTLYTHTGEGGNGQRLGARIRRTIKGLPADVTAGDVRDKVAHAILDCFGETVSPVARQWEVLQKKKLEPAQYADFLKHHTKAEGGLIALAVDDKPIAMVFEGSSSSWLLEEKTPLYVLGSGQSVGHPFLSFVRRTLWAGKQPYVDDAVLGILWMLQHAIDHVAFGVGGDPHVAVLRKEDGQWTVKQLTDDDLAGAQQLIKEIDQAIRDVGKKTRPAAPIPA